MVGRAWLTSGRLRIDGRRVAGAECPSSVPSAAPRRAFSGHSDTARLVPCLPSDLRSSTFNLMSRDPESRHRRAFNEPGHAHELTFTCYRRFRFLSAERTCDWLARAIDDARSKLDFALWAFVFMPEHVHLVVCPRRIEYKVADILKAIKEPVGRQAVEHVRLHAPEWLPRITRRRGQRVERLFWQSGGGFDRNITAQRTLMAMIDYIHLNPVRRGLVERASDWHWSSAGWSEGKAGCPLVPDRIPPEWVPLG